MATINYIDKIDNHEPPEGLVTAADMNEIKYAVNENESTGRTSVLDFGVVADGDYDTGEGTDNTVAMQAAIDSGDRLILPQGLIVCNGELKLHWRTDILGSGKSSGLYFVYPDSSTLNAIWMATGVQLSDFSIYQRASNFNGSILYNNSEYYQQELDNSVGDAGNTRGHDLKVLDVMIFKVPSTDYTGVAIRYEQTGKGKSDYGHIYGDVDIIGDYKWAVMISIGQDYVDGTPDLVTAWTNGLTFNHININKCENGIRTIKTNTANNQVTPPKEIGYLKLLNIQMQCQTDISERFVHIGVGNRVYIENCRAWDWSVAKDDPDTGAKFKAYYINEDISSVGDSDKETKAISLVNSTLDLSNVEIAADLSPTAYNVNVSGSQQPYGGTGSIDDLTPTGTDGKFTYLDLNRLPPGKYSGSFTRAYAEALGIDMTVSAIDQAQVIVLEVTVSRSNRKYFQVWRANTTTTGSSLGKSAQSYWHGSFPLSNLDPSGHAWMTANINPEWWVNANGDSPQDFYYTDTAKQSPEPKAGFSYFNTDLNKKLIWNGTWVEGGMGVGIWVDTDGLQSIGTTAEYADILYKQGFTFWDIELAAVVVAQVSNDRVRINRGPLQDLAIANKLQVGDKFEVINRDAMQVVIEAITPITLESWYKTTDALGVQVMVQVINMP